MVELVILYVLAAVVVASALVGIGALICRYVRTHSEAIRKAAVIAIAALILVAMLLIPGLVRGEGTTVTLRIDTGKYITSADVAYVDENGVEVRDIRFKWAGLDFGWYDDDYHPGATYEVEIVDGEVVSAIDLAEKPHKQWAIWEDIVYWIFKGIIYLAVIALLLFVFVLPFVIAIIGG